MATNPSLYQKHKLVYQQIREVAPEDDLDPEYSETRPAARRSWFPRKSTALLLPLVAIFASASLYLYTKLNHVLKEQNGYSTDWGM